MSESLKKKTGTALIWSFIDKGGQQVIQVLAVYILARILLPEDFGVVAYLALFSAIANMLQESGFSSALIRKQNVSEAEYNTVFYFNVSISFVVYILFYFGVPWGINTFAKAPDPILTDLSRFIFISFIFNAFAIVQNIHLQKKLAFRKNTQITVIAGCIAAAVAIYMAKMGYGAWSLAAQLVMQSFVRTVLLWVFIKWKPALQFSWTHLKSMLPYSSKLLFSGILGQVSTNIFSLIIGDRFSIHQAGIYSKANQFNMIPQSVITDGIKSVAYPILSTVEEEERQVRVFRKIIRITAFIAFPVAAMMIVMAKPIILILLTHKFAESIPILQILSIGGVAYPFFVLVGVLMQRLGKSGQLMKVETTKNALLLLSALVSVRFGVLGIVWGITIVQFLSFFWGYYTVEKQFPYKLKEVLSDIVPYIAISIVAFVPVYFLERVIVFDPVHLFTITIPSVLSLPVNVTSYMVLLVVQSISGIGLYLLITKMLGSKILDDCIGFFKGKGLN